MGNLRCSPFRRASLRGPELRLKISALASLLVLGGIVLSSPAMVASAAVSTGVDGSCVSSGQRVGYSPNIDGGSISVVNLDHNAIVGTIPGFTFPWNASVNPAGTKLYVDNAPALSPLTNSVTVVDLCTQTIEKQFPTIGVPFSDMNPAGTQLIVTEIESSQILVIDTTTDTVAHRFTSLLPVPIATVEYGNTLWVANASGLVNTINVDTGAQSAPFFMGVVPQVLAMSPDGSTLASANLGGNVTLLDTKTMTERTVSDGAGTYPAYLAFTPSGNELWVSFEGGQVAVIDPESATIRQVAATSGICFAVTVAPDGKAAFVSCTPSGTVVPILGPAYIVPTELRAWHPGGIIRVFSTSTLSQTATITAGNVPGALAIPGDTS
jgi:DNA-binding beta-propeller fold protein YncE